TVTAMSFGPRLSAPRQRAINSNSAVESGPPETARTRPETQASGANNAFASAAESGAASSAADTLLFSLDPLLHRGRCAWKFAQEAMEGVFSERVVLAKHIAISEIVFVARGLRGRERGERAAGSRVLRRLPRLRAALRSHGCEIERRGGAASAGSADRRLARI